jgi:hypothetical protein
LTIAASTGSTDTTAVGLAYDGSVATSWETTGPTPQPRATLTLDLGASRTLTGVKWVYRETGGADEVLIQTSADTVSWRTVGRYGNAPAGSWYGEDLARDGRYVRFMFLNPNGDVLLGSLAEVQIWGGVSYPPGTASPRLGGTKLTIARSYSSRNANTPSRAYDGNTSTSWETTATTPASAELKLDLGRTRRLSGITWRYRVTGSADEVLIQTSTDNTTWRTVGRYGNAPAGKVYGVATVRDARYVRLTVRNPNRDPVLGYLAEVEVWGSTTTATVTAAQAAAVRPTPTPTVTPTPTATAPPSPSPTATATATATPKPTEAAPTAAAPTEAASERSGLVVGTGGDGVRCRVAPSVDAEVLTVVPEGNSLPITGDVQDGWYPVVCGEGAGFVRAEFLAVDGTQPDATTTDPAPTATDTDSDTATAPEPTVAATPTPYAVVGAGDTEQSGTAALVVDGDPDTAWLVAPQASPHEARLVLDLGEVRPISRIEWELATSGMLGTFEIWLSTDNETWWSLGPIDGTTLAPGTGYAVEVGSEARYVAVVVPNVSGQGQVGGVGEVRIWPADRAAPLTDRGAPVTPTPVIDTAAQSTEAPTEEPAEGEAGEEPPPAEEPTPADEGEGG